MRGLSGINYNNVMLSIVGVMMGGMVMGYFFRGKRLACISRLIMIVIFILLFLLGINVGENKQIMGNLGVIGGEAVVITFGAVAGSVVCAWVIYKFYFSGR